MAELRPIRVGGMPRFSMMMLSSGRPRPIAMPTARDRCHRRDQRCASGSARPAVDVLRTCGCDMRMYPLERVADMSSATVHGRRPPGRPNGKRRVVLRGQCFSSSSTMAVIAGISTVEMSSKMSIQCRS